MRGLFSGMLRGVSDHPEGSEILTFLFRSSTSVQLAPTSPKLVEGVFCELYLDGVLSSSVSLGVGRQAAVAVSGDAMVFLALAAVLVWRFI